MLKNSDYIYGYILDPDNLAKKAQVGVDLTVKSISKIEGEFLLYNDVSISKGTGNTMARLIPVETDRSNRLRIERDTVYSLEFDQGLLNLPEWITAIIYQRSTLARNGLFIRSSVYDPGFGCPNMGAILYAYNDGMIELHSRVAQILFFQNEPVTNLYDGQYNNKNTARS